MTTAARPKEFTGKHMLITVVSFFAVVIGVNLTLAYFANSTWSGLIVNNGYVASQSFGKDLERAHAQEALGWTAQVFHENGNVTVKFTDRQQQALTGLTVTGDLRRPATDKLDQHLAFTAEGGTYRAPANLIPGVWELEVDASTADGQPFRKIYRFFVKG